MKTVAQQFAIDYNRIDTVVKNNLKLTNYNNNSFIKSLRNQLDSGKLLTNAQIKALKKMDTLGNFNRAMKKARA